MPVPCEAKAKFSEVLRKVRTGKRVTVSYRGEQIAEIVPLKGATSHLEERLRDLEDRGFNSRFSRTSAARNSASSRLGGKSPVESIQTAAQTDSGRLVQTWCQQAGRVNARELQ